MKINTLRKKLGIAVLSAAVAVSAGAFYLSTPKSSAKTVSTQKKVEKNYPNLLSSSTNGKEETTYVILDKDGNQQNVYVSEWLKNGKKKDELKDRSSLNGIKNTSGNETYTKNGSNLTWKADGNDIHYQGTTDKELPIEVGISYYLNGKEVSADKIAGKSGNVEIHFDYSVNRTDVVSADGKGYTMTHPYTVASGLVLDNSHFSDIQVNNGKSVNDGNSSVVLGIAFPGLQQDLNLKKSQLNIPDSVVIKAKAKDFQIDGTYTAAMSGVLGQMDTSKTDSVKDKIEQLEKGLDQLSASSDKLVSGSAKLASGAGTLANGTGSLVSGADQLQAGTQSLAEGSSELQSGTQTLLQGTQTLKNGSGKLVSGAAQLSSGLTKLAGNNAKLNQATQQLETQIFSTVETQVNTALKAQNMKSVNLTPSNYKQVLNGVSSGAVNSAVSQLQAGVKKSSPSLTDDQVNTILSLAYNKLAAQKNLSPSTAEIQSAVKAAGEDAQKAAFVQAAVKNYSDAAKKSLQASGAQVTEENVQGTAIAIALAAQNKEDVSNPQNIVKYQKTAQEYGAAALDYQNASKNASSNVKALGSLAAASSKDAQSAMKGLKDAEKTLDDIVSYTASVSQYTSGVASASSGASQLYSGIRKLDQGVGSLESGAAKLHNGTGSLVSGSNKLNDGAGQLAAGAGKLDSGAAQLASGADTLANGMKAFDEQGIDKMVSSLSDAGLDELGARLQAAAEASKKPVFLGGKADSMKGESRLIFKTDEVK